MKKIAAALLLSCAFAGCASVAPRASAPGFIVYSQHRAADGSFWYRTEAGPMPYAACAAALKRVTTRDKVRQTVWYDVTTALLEKHFGHPAVPTLGSWLGCWAHGTDLGLPDS